MSSPTSRWDCDDRRAAARHRQMTAWRSPPRPLPRRAGRRPRGSDWRSWRSRSSWIALLPWLVALPRLQAALCLLQVGIAAAGIAKSTVPVPRPIALVTFVFIFSWLGVAPIYQLSHGRAAWLDSSVLQSPDVTQALVLMVLATGRPVHRDAASVVLPELGAPHAHADPRPAALRLPRLPARLPRSDAGGRGRRRRTRGHVQQPVRSRRSAGRTGSRAGPGGRPGPRSRVDPAGGPGHGGRLPDPRARDQPDQEPGMARGQCSRRRDGRGRPWPRGSPGEPLRQHPRAQCRRSRFPRPARPAPAVAASRRLDGGRTAGRHTGGLSGGQLLPRRPARSATSRDSNRWRARTSTGSSR